MENNSSTRAREIVLQTVGKEARGKITIIEFSAGERMARASLSLVLLLFLTIAAAFIPVAHFVLVPLGLLLTVLVVTSKLGATRVIEGGEGTCPGCGAPFHIMRRGYRETFQDVCESCRRAVQVRTVPSHNP